FLEEDGGALVPGLHGGVRDPGAGGVDHRPFDCAAIGLRRECAGEENGRGERAQQSHWETPCKMDRLHGRELKLTVLNCPRSSQVLGRCDFKNSRTKRSWRAFTSSALFFDQS